jgi:predicted nucleotidyltransferase
VRFASSSPPWQPPRHDQHLPHADAQRYGLLLGAISAIQQVLAADREVERAILYGSRAIGRHRPASDFDLTLIGAAITPHTIARIEAELDDLHLPWMVDLSRLSDLSHPPLGAHIARVGELLDEREPARPGAS